MQQRFDEPGSLYRFRGETLVRCPACGGRATVRSSGATRLTCPHCALARDWNGRMHLRDAGGRPRTAVVSRHSGRLVWEDSGRAVSGVECDPAWEEHFGVPLWLTAECCGGRLLWLLNEAHLDWLEGFVAAGLRERPAGGPPAPSASSSRLARKLPAWIQEAKHRDEVLRELRRLRATLD